MTESEGVSRRLAAILMADAVGYSPLMQQDEERTVASLGACRAIFSKQIDSHRGHPVNAPYANENASKKSSAGSKP